MPGITISTAALAADLSPTEITALYRLLGSSGVNAEPDGRTLLIFSYPGIGVGEIYSELSGCTGQICELRDAAAELDQLGIRVIGLSPGTVATEMQVQIKASGVNPVSQLNWEDHIPADWPAKCLLWMCGNEADAYLGEEISLRDETIRRQIGVVA